MEPVIDLPRTVWLLKMQPSNMSWMSVETSSSSKGILTEMSGKVRARPLHREIHCWYNMMCSDVRPKVTIPNTCASMANGKRLYR
jgi:hypothetical protein